jgi:hypothetical protein
LNIQVRACVRIQTLGDFIGNRTGDFALKTNQVHYSALVASAFIVAQVAFITLGPKMFVRSGIDQLGSDPYPVPGTHDRAFDYRVNPKFLGDISQGLFSLLIAFDRGVRDDRERADFG